MASTAAFLCGTPLLQAPRVRAARPVSVQVVASTNKREARKAKHLRIRSKVSGTPERPRLCVFRSNNHMYAQVIDDVSGHTLAAACTLTKEIREELNGEAAGNQNAALLVGKRLAAVCAEAGITKVAFDRAGYKYHGRVKAVADAAREGGLEF